MNILAVIHGENVRAGVFADAISERGDELEEWSLAWGTAPPRPLDDYGAVGGLSGANHPHPRKPPLHITASTSDPRSATPAVLLQSLDVPRLLPGRLA